MPRRLPPQLPRVFRGSDAVREGYLTPAQLRGPLVERLVRGVYCRRGTPVSHALRVEAVGLVLSDGAQVTGASAATVLGVQLSGFRDPVEVVLPDRSHQERYRGVDFRRIVAPLDDGTLWRTAVLADPRRMAFDLAARSPVADGVARLDAVVRAGLVEVDEVERWLRGRRDNNVRAVRQALALVDPRAQSLPESRCRVALTLAGLDVKPQHEVRHRGRFVAKVDLAIVASRLAIEYDGQWHVLREQLEKDRVRLNALHEAGWSVVHVTAALLSRPDELVDVVRRAMLRAAA